MSIQAIGRTEKTIAEVRNGALSFAGKLDSGETLTGTPTYTVSPSSGLGTVDTLAVNLAAIAINGETVAIGEAVTYRVAADGTTPGVYQVRIRCATSTGQTLEADCEWELLA